MLPFVSKGQNRSGALKIVVQKKEGIIVQCEVFKKYSE